MSDAGEQMLRLLASGVSPADVRRGAPIARVGGSAGGVGEVDFARLLERATEGTLNTGRPVTIDQKAGVELREDQLRRLADATDRAEAAGIFNAVAVIDGRMLVLDVVNRTITGQIDQADPTALTGIDGFVVAEAGPEQPNGEDEPAALIGAVPIRGPAAGVLNTSLADVLRRAIGS